jgi:PTS system nitrogen regulatory IIA component
MLLSDLLTPERVDLEVERSSLDKPRALTRLASMLASGSGALAADVERVLTEREDLQSTGIGDGVAIPHGAMPDLAQQYAALLVAPLGVEFAAIDGAPVSILFAVIGPKRASGEHLKTLARISRVLRSRDFRERLRSAQNRAQLLELLRAEEGEIGVDRASGPSDAR